MSIMESLNGGGAEVAAPYAARSRGRTPAISVLSAALILAAGVSTAPAQVLHVNDRWDECAIVIAPSLTQEAWHRFVSEVGLVAYFRPLASARPLGRGKVEVSALQWSTQIDQTVDAWNDTFSHPDSTHWLFDGDALPIMGLMVRAGVSDRADLGVYFTKAPSSNYGFLGGQLQYSVLNDPERNLAAAARVSAVGLLGPEDLTTSVYGVDLLVSRNYSILSPYAGVSGFLSHGREHTTKVDLKNETVVGVQGTIGAAVRISVLRLGAEYNLAKVPGYSFKFGLGF